MDIKSAFTILGSGEPVFELISQDVDNTYNVSLAEEKGYKFNEDE